MPDLVCRVKYSLILIVGPLQGTYTPLTLITRNLESPVDPSLYVFGLWQEFRDRLTFPNGWS